MKYGSLQTSIKIPFRSFPKDTSILWPIIDAKLTNKEYSLPQPVRALIDSGASHSILHPFIAEMLGFDFKKLGPSKAGGTSASGAYKFWVLPEPILLDIYGYSFQRNFIIIDTSQFIWACILGEDSIFDVARIDFQKFKGYFELRFRTDIY